MAVAEINTSLIINGYLELLKNLSPDSKLELISKLSTSTKSDLNKTKSSIKKAYGALETEMTTEEIIKEIRESRISTRQIEPL